MLLGTVALFVMTGFRAIASHSANHYENLIAAFPTAAGPSSGTSASTAGPVSAPSSRMSSGTSTHKLASLDPVQRGGSVQQTHADKIYGTYRVSARYTCTPMTPGSLVAGKTVQQPSDIETGKRVISESRHTMFINPDRGTIVSVDTAAQMSGRLSSSASQQTVRDHNFQASADFRIDSKHDVLVVSDEVVDFDGVNAGSAHISVRNNGTVYRIRSVDQGDTIRRVDQSHFLIAPSSKDISENPAEPPLAQSMLCDISETGFRISQAY